MKLKDRITSFFTRVGVKMGIIKEIQSIEQHRKIDVDSEILNRIRKNKAIYQGYYKEWHDYTYINSQGIRKDGKMLTMGMGKVLPQKMAQLIFNEKCKIDVATKGLDITDEGGLDPANDFILDVLRNNHFYRDFQRYLEYGFALGGMAIKVYEHEGKIKLSYATAESFYPLSNDSENIDEAVFVNTEKHDGKYYTLLEWNEWQNGKYVITNELYESEHKDTLGHKVPLATIYEDLEDRTELENISRPLFVYFKLNTANNFDLTSPLGISIYENSYDTLRLIDYLYDYMMHEFKLGKRRIAVDYSMIKPLIDENGKVREVFDSEDTVYKALNMEGQGVQDLSVGLRIGEIIQGINTNLNILASQVGLSSGTFTFDGQKMVTATQVISVNSLTYQTKNSHETLIEHGIKELITTILEVAIATGLYTGESDVDVAVDFDDSIAQDRQQNLDFYSQAMQMGLIPIKEAIQRVFKVTDKEAEKWMAEINEDKAKSMQLAMLSVPDDYGDNYGVGASNSDMDDESQAGE